MAANKKITELTAGTTPSGAEKIPAVQGGVNVYLTADQIANAGVTAYTDLSDAETAELPTLNSPLEAALADKVDYATPAVIGAGSTNITRTTHLNRPLTVNQAGATGAVFAATATSGALAGDGFECLNVGAGTMTASGAITAATGWKLTAVTGETLTALYDEDTDAFYSTTPDPAAGTGDMVLASVQTVTGKKTFGSAGAVGKFAIAGTTSGSTILDAAAVAGSGTVTLPTTGTLATLDGSETLTNKTLTNAIVGTQTPSDNSTKAASTAYVDAAVSGVGSGTVTHTGGALTSNALVLGAGLADTKVAAGLTTDGTSAINLGAAGASVGKVVLANATSGTITIQPPTGALGTVTLTPPATTGTIALTSQITGTNSGTNTGDQTITLTGDVTGSGVGSFAATIANAAVTLAKQANLAQDQFIGRVTASTGAPETATITAAARTVLDDTTTAAMLTTLGAQPVDADLTTIAGLTATTDNFIQSKSSAWASRTVAQVSADLQATGLVTDAVGFRTIPQNSQSTAYTTVAADSGKHILHPSGDANARTFTIDSNANVAYPVGTCITFVNQTSQVVSIAITSDTLTLANSTTSGTRSLAQNGVATALKITSTIWVISGAGLT